MRVFLKTLILTFLVIAIGACDSSSPSNPQEELKDLSVHIIKPDTYTCINPGTTVQFQASRTASSPITLSWTFGDPSIPNAGNTDAPSVTFNNRGVWIVKVTAKTATETREDHIVILVKNDCTPLKATIDSPVARISYINEGDSVVFAGTGSGGDPPLTFLWDFPGTGYPDVTVEDPGGRQFNLAGHYLVGFEVTDATGDRIRDVVEIYVAAVGLEPPLGTVPVAVTSPDGMFLMRNAVGFGALSSEFVLLVGGGDGTTLIDPVAGSVLSSNFVVSSETRYGVLGLTHVTINRVTPGRGVSVTAGREDVVVEYGPTSRLTFYDYTANDWSSFSMLIEPSASVFDISPYNNAQDTEGMIVVADFRISFIDWDAGLDSYQPATSEYLTSVFPGAFGFASAFGRGATGRYVVVSSGSPGAIYTHDRTPDDAVLVGAVGDDPRKVRGADSVLVITNFASDSVTVAKWGSNGNVSIVGNVAVGDGPVGVDILKLGNGNIAAVTTGFNDNTFTVTVLDPDGGVVSNTTTALPGGCTSPGHAVWVGGTSTRIIVSCYGSNNIVVVDSGL